MVDRVIIGQASTTRGGSGGYGIWISRPGSNVHTCAADELLFSSNSADQVDTALIMQSIDVGSVAAGSSATATQTTTASGNENNFYFNEPVTNTMTTSLSGTTLTLATSASFGFSADDGNQTVTTTVPTQTLRVWAFKPISNLALF